MLNQVNYYTIDEHSENQRIDNFLIHTLKSVPKSHIYKIIRNNEVRVNKKRIDNTYKLQLGDIVRVPPIFIEEQKKQAFTVSKSNTAHIQLHILYEDDTLLAIHKPQGMAVHGGSGVSFGVIEYLRAQTKYEHSFLELVHRLDKETSGVLLLAKKRSALVHLHAQIRDGKCLKKYYAIVSGHWHNDKQNLRFALKKTVLPNGERKVFVDEEHGQAAHTIAYLKAHQQIANHVCSLLELELKTGRTHQIRVHLAHAGYSILGDEKYGNFALNKQLQHIKKTDFDYRMYLHAYLFGFIHPQTGQYIELCAHIDWAAASNLDDKK
jgi:23S rRNA pseudouridine955/2504/2580 synthase